MIKPHPTDDTHMSKQQALDKTKDKKTSRSWLFLI